MRNLKYKLDHKFAEIICTSFIRPILEYSDVIWDNLHEFVNNEIANNTVMILLQMTLTDTYLNIIYP